MTGPRQPPTAEGREAFEVRELEELGAYIEGGLDADRRQRIAKRLLEDEEFFGVYAEALEFRVWEESAVASKREPEPSIQPVDAVVPFPRPPRSRLWLQAAALAALLAGGSWWLIALRAPSRPVMVLAGQLGGDVASERMEPAWTRLDWFEPRTGDPQAGLSGEAIVARLGVRLVQVQVAHQQSDLGELRSLVAEVERLCNAADLEAGVPRYSAAFHLGFSEQVEGKRFTQQVEETQAGLQEAARADDLSAVFAVAQWAELGRLASRFGDQDLLESSTFSRLRQGWRDHAFEPAVQSALDRALQALELEETDTLEIRFSDLILALAG